LVENPLTWKTRAAYTANAHQNNTAPSTELWCVSFLSGGGAALFLEGEVRIYVQCPICGVGGVLRKDKVKPADIAWCNNPRTEDGQWVAWIGIDPDDVEILPD
jgi:hypothetical protein